MSINKTMKWSLTAVAIAVLAVVLVTQRSASKRAAWAAMAQAQAGGFSLSALDSALDSVEDETVAGWVEYRLAMQLYSEGGASNLQRAESVAVAALRDRPQHPSNPWLRQLLSALATYPGLRTG